jgi:hypothetical protein
MDAIICVGLTCMTRVRDMPPWVIMICIATLSGEMAPPKSQKPGAAPTQRTSFLAPLPGRQSVVPLARPLVESLAGDDTLAGLMARIRASQARLDALADVLPGLLRQHLRAGPLDDDGWTILAANSAVASKLRHLLPTLAETLVAKGWQATSIRIKVQSTQAPGR